jgi:hypothetical protein
LNHRFRLRSNGIMWKHFNCKINFTLVPPLLCLPMHILACCWKVGF